MHLNHFPKSLPDFLLQQWFTLNARDWCDPQGFPIATLDRCRPAARIPRHDRDDIEIVGICACRGSAPSRSSIQTAGFRHRDTENAVSRRATESVKQFFSLPLYLAEFNIADVRLLNDGIGTMRTESFFGILWRICSLALLFSGTVFAESTLAPEPPELLLAARILDIRSGSYLTDAAIVVEGGRIKAIGGATALRRQVPESAKIIDLGDATVLPGLIDCHTHLMARIADEPNGYALNLLTKSQAYRALEGAANARATLEAGFTTVRDVENEGSGYADVALRDAINAGLVEGPRMRVATRGIAAVGQYFPFAISPDLTDFPTGAQMVSGAEEARRAVREQIGHGADLIKVYADWRNPTLTIAEMQVIVEEAHKAQRKVAAHATTPEGIRNAVMAGVDSIEHGHRGDRAVLELMKSKGVYLVPTLSVIDAMVAKSPDEWTSDKDRAFLESMRQSMAIAKQIGVKIADGSDPAAADRH
jgi:imidazolonepropionase-like amidohydrolase